MTAFTPLLCVTLHHCATAGVYFIIQVLDTKPVDRSRIFFFLLFRLWYYIVIDRPVFYKYMESQ